MEWRDDAASAWRAEDVQAGVVREAQDDFGQAPPVSGVCFRRWMQLARTEAVGAESGYAIGRRVLDILCEDSGEADVNQCSLDM